jgi:hypothetical protein
LKFSHTKTLQPNVGKYIYPFIRNGVLTDGDLNKKMDKQGIYIKKHFLGLVAWVTPAAAAWAHFDGLKSLLHFELSASTYSFRTHFSCPTLIGFD